MKTIKIIDLLNKIANGEEVPKKIRYNSIYRSPLVYDEQAEDYDNNGKSYMFVYLFSYKIPSKFLNNEVEIIEEKKK